jgi:hypothetical protein
MLVKKPQTVEVDLDCMGEAPVFGHPQIRSSDRVLMPQAAWRPPIRRNCWYAVLGKIK